MHSGRGDGDAGCLSQKFGWSGNVTGASHMDLKSSLLVHAPAIKDKGHALIGMDFEAQVRAFVVNFNVSLLVFFC